MRATASLLIGKTRLFAKNVVRHNLISHNRHNQEQKFLLQFRSFSQNYLITFKDDYKLWMETYNLNEINETFFKGKNIAYYYNYSY